MPVTFCETTKQFLLHTDHTTYGMELYDGCLAHVYWGPRISKLPGLDELYPYGFGSGFSGTDLPGRRFWSTDMLPQEYPTFGSADMRHPALHIRYPDGNAVTRLRYASHRIYPGKQPLAGLPAAYGEESDCETLEITLADEIADILVDLQYTVFPKLDVLTRSARIQNLGKVPCTLERALSFSMDLSDSRYQLIHLPGAWARERHAVRTELTQGSILLDSKRGTSSHNENPCMALVRPETTETTGEAMGFCLVYSGSFAGEAAVEQFGSVR
ncbi:MAG: glycoside hydrolase family 36 N-terminal domain-containing protein, partial [Oscillospiraceae bacterium]|nr:glycoside hydrolase family 36 N-terminal domain-containing protein [Oscillospiraceae bacterium]